MMLPHEIDHIERCAKRDMEIAERFNLHRAREQIRWTLRLIDEVRRLKGEAQ